MFTKEQTSTINGVDENKMIMVLTESGKTRTFINLVEINLYLRCVLVSKISNNYRTMFVTIRLYIKNVQGFKSQLLQGIV